MGACCAALTAASTGAMKAEKEKKSRHRICRLFFLSAGIGHYASFRCFSSSTHCSRYALMMLWYGTPVRSDSALK